MNRTVRWKCARKMSAVSLLFVALVCVVCAPAQGQPMPLKAIVTPSNVILKDGKPLTFAIHGFIEFKTLAEVFPYIEAQKARWRGKISEAEIGRLGIALVREAVESRVISMLDERPLEPLLTHTAGELKSAINGLKEPLPAGYLEAFLAVQKKWKHSLNCWSAAPTVPARVLSNWYPIEEGIELYGATYDSTEHFWQAVKFHPDVTVGQVKELTKSLESRDWATWLKRLDDDPKIYLPNAYAVEFLRFNLTAERMKWFLDELGTHGLRESEKARAAQQRNGAAFRFTASEDKLIFGDLADVFHLVYLFSSADDPIRARLAEFHFDGVYLGERKIGFISEDFRLQMLEIWKVKYLKLARFREVIRLIPAEIRLEHFLNDGDSPDIPIPVYVGYLNQIREMAGKEAN